MTHQADIHIFKNPIRLWEESGHSVSVTSREKEVLTPLIDSMGISHISLGRCADSNAGLALELVTRCLRLMTIIRKERPDVITSIAGTFSSPVGRLLGIPTVTFYDTEHAKVSNFIAYSTTQHLVLPTCYLTPPKRNYISYDGYHELSYLHPDYFTPDTEIKNELGVGVHERLVIMRFVSRNAAHDIGHGGLPLKAKLKAVQVFSKIAKVFISSEEPLPDDLETYSFPLSPDKMHDALSAADLLFGESSTMASESAVLGTPAIYLDFKHRGYTLAQEKKYGLVFNYTLSADDIEFSIDKGLEILNDREASTEWEEKSSRLLFDNIDVASFIAELVEKIGSKQKVKSIYRRTDPHEEQHV